MILVNFGDECVVGFESLESWLVIFVSPIARHLLSPEVVKALQVVEGESQPEAIVDEAGGLRDVPHEFLKGNSNLRILPYMLQEIE